MEHIIFGQWYRSTFSLCLRSQRKSQRIPQEGDEERIAAQRVEIPVLQIREETVEMVLAPTERVQQETVEVPSHRLWMRQSGWYWSHMYEGSIGLLQVLKVTA